MNFVPFKLETKRKEKKEVINLGKMEEEERELIILINSTWEEMALQPSGAKRDRMEGGTWVPPGSLALPSTQMPRRKRVGGLGPGGSVDLVATHWPWTLDWSSCSRQPGSLWGRVENAHSQDSIWQTQNSGRARCRACSEQRVCPV